MYKPDHVCVPQATTIKLHPLYVMLPCTISASLAFMLPVATPPNAIAFSYGTLKVLDMVKAHSHHFSRPQVSGLLLGCRFLFRSIRIHARFHLVNQVIQVFFPLIIIKKSNLGLIQSKDRAVLLNKSKVLYRSDTFRSIGLYNLIMLSRHFLSLSGIISICGWTCLNLRNWSKWPKCDLGFNRKSFRLLGNNLILGTMHEWSLGMKKDFVVFSCDLDFIYLCFSLNWIPEYL